MLHSAVAVFTAQMPVQLHDFRVAMSKPLQQLGILGTVAVRLGAEIMPQAVNGAIREAGLAAWRWKFVFERVDHATLESLEDSTVT